MLFKQYFLLYLCISFSLLLSSATHATDLENSLPAEQKLKLDINNEKMLTLYLPDSAHYNKGLAIICLDSGEHLGQPGISESIRNFLPKHGWHTIAITTPEFPIIDAEMAFEQKNQLVEDYQAKLITLVNAALTHGAQLGLPKYVIVSKGQVAPLFAKSLAESKLNVHQLVALNPFVFDPQLNRKLNIYWGQILTPTLLLDGSQAIDQVTAVRPQRIVRGNRPSIPLTHQILIGADQNFTGSEDTVHRWILGYLNKKI